MLLLWKFIFQLFILQGQGVPEYTRWYNSVEPLYVEKYHINAGKSWCIRLGKRQAGVCLEYNEDFIQDGIECADYFGQTHTVLVATEWRCCMLPFLHYGALTQQNSSLPALVSRGSGHPSVENTLFHSMKGSFHCARGHWDSHWEQWYQAGYVGQKVGVRVWDLQCGWGMGHNGAECRSWPTNIPGVIIGTLVGVCNARGCSVLNKLELMVHSSLLCVGKSS
jgi:hypothetical protein